MNLKNKPLSRAFYERPTPEVAHDLIGKILIREYNGQQLAGIINETEAYCGPLDPASHAYKGATKRNKAMFGPVGHSYVYFTYGNHYCLNLVARDAHIKAGGVLIRGMVPIAGIAVMQQARGAVAPANLTNGPGKIGQALYLTLADNHIDLTKKGELYVIDGPKIDPGSISATERIGISKAKEKLWRFVLNNDALSTII